MINLCECKPGDCLVAKDNSLFFYFKYRKNGVYKHFIKRRLIDYFSYTVNDEGKHLMKEDTDNDIVKIIPQKTPNFYFTIYEYLRFIK